MDDNYHQHHQFTTIHEAEHHIDHNHEMDTTIIPLVKRTEINKITGLLTQITMMEVAAIIETFIIEVEPIATIETVIITDTTIVDQTRDIRTVVFQHNIHRTTEVITIITITINITDKETIAETQTEVIDIDTDQIVTIDIILTVTETIEQVHKIENKAIDTNQEIAVKTEIVTIASKINRINNTEGQTQNNDPPGIDENEYSSESSNEDQEV